MSRRERIVGNHYQLGLEIGKGGFGTVFSALDLRNGKSVAIKQVSLIDMAKEELAAIESEIKLLKKLHHENIVKYYNTIKEEDYLYIVLEYMENGSLAQFMKKFGTLSETLVAMYITQVLRGLAYLHAQVNYNVLLPSANILTTKDGLVKIADFGVAIKLNEAQKSNSVSSSHGCRSVGCTIIELLTQKPPYFDLAPMAALFRIVQDDHPPLPKSISPALHDFIMKCFMKEPRLRLSADDLLLHPWISQIPRTKVEQSTQEVQDNVTSTDDRAAVLNTIRMYDTITRDSTSSCLEAMHEDDDESWDVDLQANAPLKLVKLAATTSHSTLPTFQLTHDDAHDPFWADEDVPPASSTPSTSTTTKTKTRHDTVGTWGDTSVGHKEGSKLHHFREADNDDGFGDGFEDEDASKGATLVRLEAAKFVEQACVSSSWTLQMFIACGGLPLLTNFLSTDDDSLHRIALTGISCTFSIQAIPKNDTCRLFVKLGVLPKLIAVYNRLVLAIFKQHTMQLVDELHKICDIFLLFSQGDVVVKEHMCDLVVLEGLLYSLNPGTAIAKHDAYSMAMVKILKCIRNMSMEPNTLENLDRAGTIPTLVQVLTDESSPQIKVRHLLGFTDTLSPLKQFVLPIMCDLASASATAREHLWACDGVTFFLTLLSDKFWQIDAMKAIAAWLVKIENVLLAPEHIQQIVLCFRTAEHQFENLLESLLEILSRSMRMNQALGRSSLFVMEILYRLSYPKPFVRKNLLKMLKCIFESHTAPVQFLVEFNIHPTILALAQETNQILIQEIASQLLQAILVSASVF
ncbi:hypothetical protein DYB38_004150 [Aphanomyces astaci]|uniref:non-specific serine/threonine protein kinase n=1 Tax=Aphanomyces astaci TaxID=112090 RepID=A0A397E9R6_APHAT|nr:hypothetical protein DYB38_004150 [Aphanomyces astaci]